MGGPVELRSGAMVCRIDPALGGAVLALRHAGEDLLRPGDGARDVLGSAAFPLVPFANRIEQGRFVAGDRTVRLRADAATPPHAHHGEGWRRAWQLVSAGPDQAELACPGGDDPGYGWPWPYRMHQRLSLGADRLVVELAVTSLADSAMPLGLGWHPYVPRTAGLTLAATASAMWHNDAAGIARTVRPSRLLTGAPVPLAALDGFDNFFVCPDPVITLDTGRHRLRLSASGAGFHLYTPKGEPWFCIEPVSHAPNAFGRGEIGPADWLAPGQTRRQRAVLSLLPASPAQGADR